MNLEQSHLERVSAKSSTFNFALGADFERVRGATEHFWQSLKGARIFLGGGTGFIGSSLLEGLVWARKSLGVNCEVVVLSRDSKSFLARWPQFMGQEFIRFHQGDVRNFHFPEGAFSHVIHGASSVALPNTKGEPESVVETIEAGTERMLQFAAYADSARFLFLSSGAIYGKQPVGVEHLTEDVSYASALESQSYVSVYGEGKRRGESLCTNAVIARGFAFVGPYLPLNTHFAIGNFIGDALKGRPISISSDGTAYRSYMYSVDLVNWLVALLTHGKIGEAYNVGSDDKISIRDLAHTVASLVRPGLEVRIGAEPTPGKAPDRYIPSVEKIKHELGVTQMFPLKDSIQRTAQFYASLKL